MLAILCQIAMIILIIIVIKDIGRNKTYPHFGIPVFMLVVYLEYSNFYNLMKQSEQQFLIFLSGVTVFLLGSLCFMLIKFYKK